jgi:hypothetical protein
VAGVALLRPRGSDQSVAAAPIAVAKVQKANEVEVGVGLFAQAGAARAGSLQVDEVGRALCSERGVTMFHRGGRQEDILEHRCVSIMWRHRISQVRT